MRSKEIFFLHCANRCFTKFGQVEALASSFVTENATIASLCLDDAMVKTNGCICVIQHMKFVYFLPTTLLLVSTVGITFSLAQSSRQLPMNSTSTAETKQNSGSPKLGGLYIQSGSQEQFPLKHTDVKAKIAGNVSRVEVTQTFENSFKEALEAVYVFPLPDQAAVDDMEIKIGDRTLKGDIKKRSEAQEIYERARKEGRTAGLLEQERDNIFTQSLANIKPGEQINVTIRYTESLKFTGGDYEFVFPMVVGPRYIPGTPIDGSGDSDRVPDASRINPQVLKPGTRSGHDIGVTVEIDAGVPVQDVRSPSHQIRTQSDGQLIKVQLGGEDTIPNKDLILRYRVSSDQTQATVLTQADQKGGHFAVYLIPAVEYRTSEIVPKDVVFLMDTSGSQAGDPLLKSQELMRRFINNLNPNDTFTIIDFANTATELSSAPLPNTPQNRAKAIDYINNLDANGGTELLNGIQAVLNFPAAQSGRLRSIVLLTDGYIGNENEVIAQVQKQLKPGNRLYSFGVGSSVNRFLLDRLAEVGRGTSQVIRQDEPTEEVAEKFYRQINNPVLTNIKVDWIGRLGDVGNTQPQIYPASPPDLFANQPLVLFGRQEYRHPGTLRITGTAAGGKRYEKTLNLNFDSNGNSAVAQLWGRARIKDLMNQMFGGETKSGVEAVTDTALAYRLLSQYTAFIAVSDQVRVNPDGTRQRVQVPVELPQGVSYEGIFGDPSYESAAPASGVMFNSAAPRQQRLRSTATREVAPSTPPAPVAVPETETADTFNQSNSRIEVIDADGLDKVAIASLTQQLQSVNLPQSVSGEIVLEFALRNRRVGRIILDDKASTLQDATVINAIKRSLVTWQPTNVSGNIRLKLRILP